MKKNAVISFILFFVFFIPVLCRAYSSLMSLKEYVLSSDIIVIGTVKEEELYKGGYFPVTKVQVDVEKYIKGKPEESTIAIFYGGAPEEESSVYHEQPIIKKGKRYLFFLRRDTKLNGYNLTNGELGNFDIENEAVIDYSIVFKEKAQNSPINNPNKVPLNEAISEIQGYIK